MGSQRTIRLVLYVTVIAVFVAARFWRLDASCLWFDEMFSVQAAEQAWGSLLGFVALDLVHPPLFYVLLKGWITVGGESIFWLRSLPVMFACFSIIPLILLTREIGSDRWRPLLALFLIAVNGSLIKYAQEVRMYTMLMFLSLVSIWLFLRYFNRGKSWVWVVLVNILLVYTHYYGWLVVGCEVLVILTFQRMKWRRIVAMAGIVFAAFLPWTLIVLKAAKSGSDLSQNIDWIERPGLRTLVSFVIDQIEPFYFQSSNIEPASVYATSVPLLILLVVSICVWLVGREPGRRSDPKAKVLVIFAILPFIVTVALSWILPYSVWGTRHMIIIAAPLMMVVAGILIDLPTVFRTVTITLMVLFSGYSAFLQMNREAPNYVWCGWEKLIADIRPQGGEQVDIVASENLVAYHAWFATRHLEGYQVAVTKGGDNIEERTYFLPRGFDAVQRTAVADISAPRIVLLYRTESPVLDDWLFQDVKAAGYTACPPRVVEYGPSTAFRVEMTREPGVCLYPY